MILKKLVIERETWGENKGKYKTEIKFDDDKGSIELILDPSISNELLVVTADEITKFSEQAARSLMVDLYESVEAAKA